MDVNTEIKKQREKIDALEKELVGARAVLEYLLSKQTDVVTTQTMTTKDEKIKPVSLNDNDVFVEFDKFDLSLVPIEIKRKSFADDVEPIVERLKYQKFTVPQIAYLMKSQGLIDDSNDKIVKAKISNVLSKLYKLGILEIVTQGGGSVPHVYRNSKKEEAISVSCTNGFDL